MISRFRTGKASEADFGWLKSLIKSLTVGVSNIDKVKADDVVTSMAAPRLGFVKAIDVKARSEYGPDRQKLHA